MSNVSNPRHVTAIMTELDQRDLLDELRDICRQHGVMPAEVLGRSHMHCYARARHHWWHHLYAKGCWSDTRIAILHGVQTSGVRCGRLAHEARTKQAT